MIQSLMGVDPGRKGAIARVTLGAAENRLEFVRIDRLPREPDKLCEEIGAIVRAWRSEGPILGCGLEEPFGVPGQGNQLSYGRCFGHLETALMLTGIPVHLHYPVHWQPRVMTRFRGVPAKVLIAHAFRQLFTLPEELYEHEGLVDAAMIALAEGVALGVIKKPTINWTPYEATPKETRRAREERTKRDKQSVAL